MEIEKKEIKNPENQLGYLLTQVSFLKQRIVNAALKELDVTYIQFVILAGTLELGGDERIVTQQDIATRRRLDKAMVSNVVKTLLEKGLIARHTHPLDKRAYTLSLTESGRRVAIRGKETALKVDRTFFEKIDKRTLMETLAILLENEEGGCDE